MPKNSDIQRDYREDEELYRSGWEWDEDGWYLKDVEGEYYTQEEALQYNKILDKE